VRPEDATGIANTEGEGDYELELKCRGCRFVYRRRFTVAPTREQIEAVQRIGEEHEGRTGHKVQP
jgi:hypothetical protein